MKIKNIVRIQTKRFFGWRFSFKRWNHYFTKYFSDESCGGNEEALEEAIAFQNEFYSYLKNHGNTEETVKDFIMIHGTTRQKEKYGFNPYQDLEKNIMKCLKTLNY